MSRHGRQGGRAAYTDMRGSDFMERTREDVERSQGQQAMLGLLFGSAAPAAARAIDFMRTPRGKGVLGVVLVGASSLLLPKVMR
jgi:hypothetical protein